MKPAANPDVLERLHRLVTLFHRRMHDAVRRDGDGLAPMEARSLSYLARHEGSTQREMVLHTGRDKAQIARIVRTLLDRGLVESTPDPADGRSQRLRLTAGGRAMQRRMQHHRGKFEQALCRGLDAAEQQALVAQLDRLLANVDEQEAR
jgi:DNA-binding MarR family transcriptional regulator